MLGREMWARTRGWVAPHQQGVLPWEAPGHWREGVDGGTRGRWQWVTGAARGRDGAEGSIGQVWGAGKQF